MTRSAITNIDLAKRLDLTHSSVSRLRAGKRTPGIDAMMRISTVLSWPVNEQARSRQAKTYHVELERRLVLWFGKAEVEAE